MQLTPSKDGQSLATMWHPSAHQSIDGWWEILNWKFASTFKHRRGLVRAALADCHIGANASNPNPTQDLLRIELPLQLRFGGPFPAQIGRARSQNQTSAQRPIVLCLPLSPYPAQRIDTRAPCLAHSTHCSGTDTILLRVSPDCHRLRLDLGYCPRILGGGNPNGEKSSSFGHCIGWSVR